MKLLSVITFTLISLWLACNPPKPGQHYIALTWTASPSTNVAYNIYRSSGGAYTKIGQNNTVGYVDSSIVSKTTYSYFVTAYNVTTKAESAGSNTFTYAVP